MSDYWKNPNFPNHGRSEWKPPFAEEDRDITISSTTMLVAMTLRAMFGLVVMVSINAVCLWGVLSLLDYPVSYANCILVSLIYIPWRAYDAVVFRKARESRQKQ